MSFHYHESSHRFKLVTICLLIAALAVVLPTGSVLKGTLVRTVRADNSPHSPLPFSQDWSNTELITQDDDWSNVPGIIGYSGKGLTYALPGHPDPQTILSDGSTTPVNVWANRNDPNMADDIKGVAEFDGIDNPVVALQGSNTAPAPHIVISINTIGAANITVAYNLRDIEGSDDNAVEPVALQFRVGSSGDYTNVPAGFVADATTGPDEATLVTPVSATLPAEANNQPLVQIRIITSNAEGNDEWIGIDDINITDDYIGPTSANGVVGGQILANDGTAVSGAVVRLDGTQSRKGITDTNGNYRFDNVETSGFYTVTPSRVNFVFSPTQRAFSQLGNNTEAIFTAAASTESANPLDTPEYFVRQQYVDLLGREPDEGGFNYWSDRIIECGNDVACVNARRRDVAAAFFIEAEFQQTGSFIYGIYKGSLGRSPVYTEFSSDRQQVIGGVNLDAKKQAFAESFVSRGEFLAKYQPDTSDESFVDALLQNVQQSSGIDLHTQRESLISRYNAGANLNESRSLVVRGLTESAAFRQAQYNAAFVLTEYFGYLRRDPETEGNNFWVDVLNNREPGNFRAMVCSFITSREYQRRFSSIVSHSNGECGQ
jgi:hypothetical protein